MQKLGAATALTVLGGALPALQSCSSGGSDNIGAGNSTTIPNSSNNNYTLSYSEFPTLENNSGTASIIVQATSATYSLYVTRVDPDTCWAVSNICTHAGTVLNAWDPTNQDYLCSSHGAKFSSTGTVLTGPNTGAQITNLAAFQGTISATGITFDIP